MVSFWRATCYFSSRCFVSYDLPFLFPKDYNVSGKNAEVIYLSGFLREHNNFARTITPKRVLKIH